MSKSVSMRPSVRLDAAAWPNPRTSRGRSARKAMDPACAATTLRVRRACRARPQKRDRNRIAGCAPPPIDPNGIAARLCTDRIKRNHVTHVAFDRLGREKGSFKAAGVVRHRMVRPWTGARPMEPPVPLRCKTFFLSFPPIRRPPSIHARYVSLKNVHGPRSGCRRTGRSS